MASLFNSVNFSRKVPSRSQRTLKPMIRTQTISRFKAVLEEEIGVSKDNLQDVTNTFSLRFSSKKLDRQTLMGVEHKFAVFETGEARLGLFVFYLALSAFAVSYIAVRWKPSVWDALLLFPPLLLAVAMHVLPSIYNKCWRMLNVLLYLLLSVVIININVREDPQLGELVLVVGMNPHLLHLDFWRTVFCSCLALAYFFVHFQLQNPTLKRSDMIELLIATGVLTCMIAYFKSKSAREHFLHEASVAYDKTILEKKTNLIKRMIANTEKQAPESKLKALQDGDISTILALAHSDDVVVRELAIKSMVNYTQSIVTAIPKEQDRPPPVNMALAAVDAINCWHRRIRNVEAGITEFNPDATAVFLGGTCGITTWRQDIAVPLLRKHKLSFYNPQVEEWHEGLVEIERKAKEEANILLFVIDTHTRGLTSILEAAYCISHGRTVVLCIENIEPDTIVEGEPLGPVEIKDNNRCRSYLRDIASKHGIPLADSIEDALNTCVSLMVSSATLIPLDTLVEITVDAPLSPSSFDEPSQSNSISLKSVRFKIVRPPPFTVRSHEGTESSAIMTPHRHTLGISPNFFRRSPTRPSVSKEVMRGSVSQSMIRASDSANTGRASDSVAGGQPKKPGSVTLHVPVPAGKSDPVQKTIVGSKSDPVQKTIVGSKSEPGPQKTHIEPSPRKRMTEPNTDKSIPTANRTGVRRACLDVSRSESRTNAPSSPSHDVLRSDGMQTSLNDSH